jgi:IclR family acetate operon transcriptional repressor
MGVKALGSALATLRAAEVVAEHQPIGVTELARRLAVTKSSAQRVLATLAEAGWIAPAPPGRGQWELTPRPWAVGRHYLEHRDFRALLAPVLRRLRDETGETVHLTVVDDDRAVIVEVAESRQPVHAASRVGAITPAIESAGGRAVLARATPARLAALVAAHPELAASLDGLEDDRRRGWSVNLGVVNPGVHAVAVPVDDGTGRTVAALVLSAPRDRLPPALAGELGGRLARAVADATGSGT